MDSFSADRLSNRVPLENINTQLRRKIHWSAGEQLALLGGSDPWCDCQDFPDEFWSELELLNLRIIDIREEHPVLRADFTLTGQLSTHAYAVELVREDNWVINRVQGFSFE